MIKYTIKAPALMKLIDNTSDLSVTVVHSR